MMTTLDMMYLKLRMVIGTAKIKQYPYRSALPSNYLFQVPRNAELENDLAKSAGAEKSNHALYEITFEDESGFVIFCSDSVMHLGCGVKVQDW